MITVKLHVIALTLEPFLLAPTTTIRVGFGLVVGKTIILCIQSHSLSKQCFRWSANTVWLCTLRWLPLLLPFLLDRSSFGLSTTGLRNIFPSRIRMGFIEIFNIVTILLLFCNSLHQLSPILANPFGEWFSCFELSLFRLTPVGTVLFE